MTHDNVPQIILHHQHGSNEWEVQLDDGKTIQLRTPELTSYRRFQLQALVQAQRFFPLMRDEEWHIIIHEALKHAQISAAFLACRYRR